MKACAAARLENIVLPLAGSGLTVYRLGNSWQHKQVELWPSQKTWGGMREEQHLTGYPSGQRCSAEAGRQQPALVLLRFPRERLGF